MAKAELEASSILYRNLISSMRAAEAKGEYELALGLAMKAWEHVEGMMRFETRWGGADFASVPCVDLVLRIAPLMLHSESLDTLASLLKARRAIDRIASDDLAARLGDARHRLNEAYRVFSLVESRPGMLQAELDDLLGGLQDRWRGVSEKLAAIGVLHREPLGNTYRLTLGTTLDAVYVAKCISCGRFSKGPADKMLLGPPCPACDKSDQFVVTHVERGV